jgi:2-iminobutanoate/2-iminopropanoate deaminase
VTTQRKALETKGAPAPISAFSLGVDADSLVFVSGQLGVDMDTGEVPEDVRDETRLVMEYLRSILAEADLEMGDVAKTTVYVTDFDDYKPINEVYANYFQAPYPARATVKVAGLLSGARVEIDAIAIRKRHD